LIESDKSQEFIVELFENFLQIFNRRNNFNEKATVADEDNELFQTDFVALPNFSIVVTLLDENLNEIDIKDNADEGLERNSFLVGFI